MAKLDTTVLVFSPDPNELICLREALEPVVSRYREATSFSEACQKSQNENMELYILGYGQDKAPVDISDFYYFARESSQNKMAQVYIWGPEMDPRLKDAKDAKIRFFNKGKFKDLIESLDAFSKTNSISYVAQKTKEVLPFFMTHTISEVKKGFEKIVKHSLVSDDLWKLAMPQTTVPSLGLLRARLVEGLFVAESLSESVDQTVLQESLGPILDQAMKISAEEVRMVDPVYKISHIEKTSLIKKELSEGSWKCIELKHADSSHALAKVYLKIRPNPTPGTV